MVQAYSECPWNQGIFNKIKPDSDHRPRNQGKLHGEEEEK